jgi:hypothetical protein
VHQILEESAGKAGQAKTDYEQALKPQLKQRLDEELKIKIAIPAFRREAWEVAVASQAASWMDAAELQRYSGIYAYQRDSSAMIAQSVAMVNGPTIIGAVSHLQLKSNNFDERSREIYRLIADYHFQLQMVQKQMQALESVIKASAAKA